jgi:hypothetical protein
MLQHIEERGIGAVFQGLPRILLVFGVVVIAVLELATRLPDLVLLPQKMQAALGEYGAKELQPKVVTTQVAKTEADTRVADTQAQLNAVQQEKVAAETKVAQMQAEVTAAQVAKTQADTRLAQMQAALTATQVQKTQAETQLTQAQTNNANIDTAQKTVGLAMQAGILGVGAKLFGMMTPPQDTTQAAQQQPPQKPTASRISLSSPIDTNSADYRQGLNEGKKYLAYVATLPPDQKAGDRFWYSVKDKNPLPDICTTKAAGNFGFQVGCQAARETYETMTTKNPPNFVAGLKAGWGG